MQWHIRAGDRSEQIGAGVVIEAPAARERIDEQVRLTGISHQEVPGHPHALESHATAAPYLDDEN